VQWWCSAQGVAWDWTWRPYVGVWVLVLLTAAGYAKLTRDAGGWRHVGWRGVAFVSGLGVVWVALDWPIGALAAGYLASVHMVQFLLVGLVAPVLLLLGVPEGAFEWLRGRSILNRALSRTTHPLVAIAGFNTILVFTHWPTVVDALMGSQAGSFAIDMLWLFGGTLFWWPLVSSVPARPGFTYPLKLAYLIANTILSTVPFLYLTFSQLPVYATYELAPPVGWMTKQQDQQLAGILMKIGGGLILWTAITVLFFRWYRAEGQP
jgi:putative membrane protein